MWTKYAYNVGGLLFTLDEIEHGILRCNKGHPNNKKAVFKESDDRKSLIMTTLDPRIHFALNCGAQSCPPIRIYQKEKLEQQVWQEIFPQPNLINNLPINPSFN